MNKQNWRIWSTQKPPPSEETIVQKSPHPNRLSVWATITNFTIFSSFIQDQQLEKF